VLAEIGAIGIVETIPVKAIELWDGIDDPKKMMLGLQADARMGKPQWRSKEPSHVGTDLWLHHWTEFFFIADHRFFLALSKTIFPVSPERWTNAPLLGSGVAEQVCRRFRFYSVYNVRRSLVRHLQVKSEMNYELRLKQKIVST